MGEYISNRRYYTLVLFVVLLASITILAERGVFESINLDFDLSISGRSIYNSNFTLFEDQINKSYNENSVYLFKPSVDTNIKSLLVSGNVSGTGYAKVYLLINRELYPVAFFSLNNETINFSNICESTCSLPTLSDDKYVLRIEVDNVLLNLNTISYSEFDMDSSIDKVPNFSKESSQTLSTQKTNKKDSEPLLNESLFQVLRPSDNWEDVDGIIDFKIKLNDIPLESCEIILNENLSYFADFKENQLIFSTELLDDGNYTWYANCSFLNNSFLSNHMNFTVNQNSSLIEIFEDVEDGLGNTQKVDIKIFIGDNLTFNLTENQHSKLIKKGNYNVELIPYNSPVKKIKVLNTSFNKNVNEFIDVDDVLGKTSLPVTKKWRQAYALNPIYKDSSYEITVIAKGEDLYKCKDWNYTERNCFGDWVKIMDLVPGDEYTFNLTPLDPAYGEGEDIFILKTIDIDGNVSDWDDILNTERNQIIDGIGGINDLDNPTTVDRDLIKFAYTWDDDYFYNYFERTTSGNLAVNLLVYLDLGNDGYMNSTDKVARYVWNGASNEIDIWIYDYVPSGTADILTGDGFDMPGTITNGILVEENLLGGSPSGSYAETRLNWSDIGIAPGTPIQFHVSSSRGINLPSQIEDNMDSRSTLLVFIDISPDQSSAGSKGDTIYYDLIITNDGNVEDTIDISTIGTLNGWTINFYQNDSVTPLNDSDSDGLIDVVLSPYTSTTIVAAVTIKASAKNGDLDQTYVYVNSSNDNSVYDYALLTTGVGAIYIYPSNYGKIASGTYIEYNHTLLNNRLQPDTINLQINVENGWYYELYNSTGGLLNDTNSDGLNDSGVMP
ncbi:hypothetical protein KY334_04425, partial [Candidatus Woesearchaeota archaeon]|nr:hypothetical protein [Candidatus Woesearchaeota archaeon]